MTMRLGAGQRSKTGRTQAGDDTVVKNDVVVTWTLLEGEGYSVSADAGSAQVVIEDNDEATFAVWVHPAEIAEGEAATLTVEISNGVTFAEDQTIALDFAGSTAVQGDDYTVSPEPLALRAGARAVAATVAVAAVHGGETVGSATVTIAASDAAPLRARVDEAPETHAGTGTFTLRIGFSEAIANGQESLSQALQVTGGTLRAVRPVGGNGERWEIEIEPASAEVVVVSLPPTADCDAAGAVCTADGKPLSNRLEATIPGETDPELPVVSIVAVASRVSEGEPAEFTVSRTGPVTEALAVPVSVTSSRNSEARTVTMQLRAGQSSKTGQSRVGDDSVVRDHVVVTWTLLEGEAYSVSADTGSAQVVIEDNDEASFAVSVDPAKIAEGEAATLTVKITGEVTFAEDQEIALDFAGSTAAKGDDYTVSPESLTLRGRARGAAATVTAVGDTETEGAERVAIAVRHGGATIGAATITITANESAALTAQFGDVPKSHDGANAFSFELQFSEEFKISYLTLRDSAFSVTNGQVTRARRKQQGSNQSWTITVKPDSSGAVTIRLPATTDCEADDAICTSDARPLSNSPSAAIPGPAAALDFAHFAKGATITSEMVLVNAATQPSRPAVYFYDTEGNPIAAESVVDITGDLEITEDGALTVRTEMEPLDELTISTHGRGELVTGSVRVVSDGPIGGVVRYGVPEIGVAGVGPGQPTSDALFPVRRQAGGIRTAAALHNLGAEAMGVRCRLMSGGVALEEVEIHLEANGQASWFIEDAFTTTDTSDFLGSVRCTAPGNGRFTAVALEMDAANRIFTTLPVVPVDPPGSGNQQTTLDFAHFANGTGITSEMVFLNPSTQPSRPAVYFYDTEGNPIAAESVVDITGDLEITEDGALTVRTEMEPLDELTISTHGRGALVSGSVRVVSEGPIGGMLRFDLPGLGAGVVGASLPISDALFPVRRQEGGINTWAAIHNLESSPGLVRCDLMREGVLLDAVSIPLEANGQTAWFIDHAFPAADTSDFAGSVRCDAVGEGRFSAVALEMDPGNRIFTTLPVVPVPEMQDRE